MLKYDTTLPNDPPFGPQFRDSVLAGLKVASPYKKYGQAHQDTLDWMGARNASRLGTEMDLLNATYDMNQQSAERDLALSGLQSMSQAKQQQQSLRDRFMQNMTGSLLSGIFR
jgi:hypothetical protein